MNGADDEPSELLEAALEQYYESEEKFVNLPEEVQVRIKRVLGQALGAALWGVSSPHRRRDMVRKWVIERHPDADLSRALKTMWNKSKEVELCEEVASNVSPKDRTMTDIQLQKIERHRLRKEWFAAAVAAQQKAKTLGLRWPDDKAWNPDPSPEIILPDAGRKKPPSVRKITMPTLIRDALIRIHSGKTLRDHPAHADLGTDRFDHTTGKLVPLDIRSYHRERLLDLARKEAGRHFSEKSFQRGLQLAMEVLELSPPIPQRSE